MTVENVIDDKERNELKDLKQQIESLSTIMKSVTVGGMKPKGREGVSSPQKKELFGNSHKRGCRGHLEKEKYLLCIWMLLILFNLM